MRREKKDITLPLGVGTSSMVAIFVILTLVVLGVLALQTAYTYRKTIDKQGNYMEAYYRTDNEGERILKEIHQIIQSTTYNYIVEAIKNNKVLNNYDELKAEGDEQFNISYKLGLNDKQYLHITIGIYNEPFQEEEIKIGRAHV